MMTLVMFKGNSFRMNESTTAALQKKFILLNEIRRFDELGPHIQELYCTHTKVHDIYTLI
jgi:hypothetical protein